MNSDKPQKPQSNYSATFDSDDIEISVSYEEITPEEKSQAKPKVPLVDSDVEQQEDEDIDMWLENDPAEIDVETSPLEVAETTAEDNNFLIRERPEAGDIPKLDKTEPNIEQSTTNDLDNLDGETFLQDLAKPNPELKLEPQENEPLTDNVSVVNETIESEEAATDTSDKNLNTESNIETEIAEETDPKEPESTSQPELIADSWLEESEKIAASSEKQEKQQQELTANIAELEQQKATLIAEINQLKQQKETIIAEQTEAITASLGTMIREGTRELREQKNNLLVEIEQLERRGERIRREMQNNFAGKSQDIAMRVQGFRKYLVGSLQELTTVAERLDLPEPEPRRRPPRESREPRSNSQSRPSSRDERRPRNRGNSPNAAPQFGEQAFANQTRRIRQFIEQYRDRPDYYGAPWQLRRTFEQIHAEKVQEWFFGQGGRGTVKGMGSRLQNILVASAIISILHQLYRDRCRILVLVDTPEKLGEWRKGLGDCLGISRNDFGANRGIVLFESADALVQRADRLLEDKLLPLIIIDEAEGMINSTLLKFPFWLAFAEKPQSRTSGYLY